MQTAVMLISQTDDNNSGNYQSDRDDFQCGRFYVQAIIDHAAREPAQNQIKTLFQIVALTFFWH
jgi:hypothetical protein